MSTDDSFMLLGEWYIKDLTKKDIDKFERAAIIRRYINNKKTINKSYSIREFAKENNLHHNTVGDWLLYDLISEEEYNKLKASGLSESSIYRHLRNNKAVVQTRSHSEINAWAEETIRRAREYKRNKVSIVSTTNSKTENLLNDAANEINSLIVELRLVEKSKNKKELGVR